MSRTKVRTTAKRGAKRKARVAREVKKVGGSWGDEVRERLAKLQKQAGSNRAFARRLGVSTSVVTRWIGEGLLGATTLRKLQQLDVSADYLLGADVPVSLSARTHVGALAKELVRHVIVDHKQKRWRVEPHLEDALAEVLGGYLSLRRPVRISRTKINAKDLRFNEPPPGAVSVDLGSTGLPYRLVVENPQQFLKAVTTWAMSVADHIASARVIPDRHARGVLAGLARQLKPDLPTSVEEKRPVLFGVTGKQREPLGGVANESGTAPWEVG